MEVRSLEAIPLEYPLKTGNEYGSVRGTVDSRTSILIRVETDSGIVGWGEAFGPPESVIAIIDELLRDTVVGMDPFEVSSLADRLYSGPYHFSRSGLFQCATSGVDIALWDLIGKETGRPLYALLGGDHDRPVRPYASTSMYAEDDSERLETALRQAAEDGFTAVKIKVGRGIDDDLERVTLAREILGEDVLLMLDVNGNYRVSQAIRLTDAVKPYDITWIEEPVPPSDRAGYKEVRTQSTVPIAGGEASFGRFEFADLFEDRCLDIAMPDLCMCGGISEARKIADLAATKNAAVSPHVWMGAVGLVASLHFANALSTYPHSQHYPEPILFEVDQGKNPFRTELLVEDLDLRGESLDVPDGPGLGVEPDLAEIEAYRLG